MKSAGRELIAIDTSSGQLSCAATRDGGKSVHHRHAESVGGRSEALVGLVRAVMSEAGISPRDIGKVVVSCGPGSFTGIRVGLSFAKGLSAAVGAECISISLLKALRFVTPLDGRSKVTVVMAGTDRAVCMLPDEGILTLSVGEELSSFVLERAGAGDSVVCDGRLSLDRLHTGISSVSPPFAEVLALVALSGACPPSPETEYLSARI